MHGLVSMCPSPALLSVLCPLVGPVAPYPQLPCLALLCDLKSGTRPAPRAELCPRTTAVWAHGDSGRVEL